MKTILIVEDDLDIRNILTIYLQREYNVVTFSNGEEALANFVIANPDLILLDVRLPGMNGYEICEKIREMNDEIPVIFLSACREEQDRLLGLKAGANEYFTKPFDINKLMESIKQYVEKYTPKL